MRRPRVRLARTGDAADMTSARERSTVQNAPGYEGYRIHTTRLTFGPYISLIVSIGKRHLVTEDSLTDTVLRVPGELRSKDEAL